MEPGFLLPSRTSRLRVLTGFAAVCSISSPHLLTNIFLPSLILGFLPLSPSPQELACLGAI